MMKQFFLILILICICIDISAIDIYISNLQAYYKNYSSREKMEQKVELLSGELKKELMRQSSDIIAYKDIGGLSPKSRKEYDAEPITDTLDALAACFFYNIEYILYGKLYIEEKENQYRATISIYAKRAGDAIHSIEFSKSVDNELDYISTLATAINQELMVKIAGYSKQAEEEDKKLLEKTKEKFTQGQETGNTSVSDQIEGADTKLKKQTGEKIFGIYASLGYFFVLNWEWMNIVMPCATLEEGVKWSIPVVNGKSLDFYIRPSLLVNYSFSVQDPENYYHRYVHYHSLAGKAGVDFMFEFSDIFGFFIGGGPHYKIEIIDYRTHGNFFYTDIPYAFGLSANAGIEFNIGSEGNLSLGIIDISDFTFFDDIFIDNKVLVHFLFRL